MNRLLYVGAMLMLLGVFGFAAPRSASATNTEAALGISYLHCDIVSGGNFRCNGNATGGTGGYTYKWTAANGAVITSGSTTTAAAGTCVVGTRAYVYFTVTDSSGAKVTGSRNFSCYGIAP